jgi:hypothetical protein
VGNGCFSPIFSLRSKDFRVTPWRGVAPDNLSAKLASNYSRLAAGGILCLADYFPDKGKDDEK